jgi:hypothetical protein
MSTTSRILCVVYALIAVAALYGTWSQNLLYSGQPGGIGAHFLNDLRVNPASRSISIDVSWIVASASLLMVTEARRIGMRLPWIYVILSFAIAVSVMVPLFLLARELRLASDNPAKAPAHIMRVLDVVGMGVVVALVGYLAIWLR